MITIFYISSFIFAILDMSLNQRTFDAHIKSQDPSIECPDLDSSIEARKFRISESLLCQQLLCPDQTIVNLDSIGALNHALGTITAPYVANLPW